VSPARGEPILLAWSSGKDSALALHELRRGENEVVALLTVLTDEYDRVSMHGVREDLLEQQALALGLNLCKVRIPPDCGEGRYETAMAEALAPFRRRGVRRVAFGDLYLEGIREYREAKLAEAGMDAAFPLWGADTRDLSRRFIEDGFVAVVTCVDSRSLEGAFAGRLYDEALLADLPEGVDPCGENGEFHTFAFDGPPFLRPVGFRIGRRVLRDERFWFRDLLGPGQGPPREP